MCDTKDERDQFFIFVVVTPIFADQASYVKVSGPAGYTSIL